MRSETTPKFGAHPELFDQFVEHRRALGHTYSYSTVALAARLSRHIARFAPLPGILTEEMVRDFCRPDPARAAKTTKMRWSMARQFGLFLRLNGHPAWVAGDFEGPRPAGFDPRILTEGEMALVIAQADRRPGVPQYPTSKPVYSMLTRMLWCCGLRIGEALDLAVGDVDLGAGVLTVTTAKGRRVRIVPMSQSLADYARGYADRMGLAAQPPEAWFYPSPLGGQYQVDGASTHIQKIMLEAGVTVDGTRAPRTHDIRHSYAVQALYQMDIGGTDARAGLPVLAAVMGHADIKSTEYYLRLTAHHRPNVDAAMADAYRGVFPEAD